MRVGLTSNVSLFYLHTCQATPQPSTKLSDLKAPFCQWLASTHVKLAADEKTILRGWEQAGLLEAWGKNQDKLFADAMALNEKKELFGEINAASTKATAGCDPELVEAASSSTQAVVDGSGGTVEGPEWEECHDDDLGEDEAADEACSLPEELTDFCIRRAALGLRVAPKSRN